MINQEGCKKCPLAETAQKGQCVWGTGPTNAKIMLVGQNPGREEIRTGAPFVGPSGQLLDTVLESTGIRRDTVYVSNAVKCYTERNQEPPKKSISSCRSYLAEEIRQVTPSVIVAMGNTALQSLTGSGRVLSKMGQVLALNDKSFGDTAIPVLPAPHPAYILKGNLQAKEDLIRALSRAGALITGEASSARPNLLRIPNLESAVCQKPSEHSLESLTNSISKAISKAPTISFDIETNGRELSDPQFKIYLIGMDDGNQVTVWGPSPDAIAQASDLLLSRMTSGKLTVGHSAVRFDTPALNAPAQTHTFIAATTPTVWPTVWTLQRKTQDTLLLAHLANENRSSYALEALSQIILGYPAWKGMVSWNWRDTPEEDIPWDIAAEYNAYDCRSTFLLWQKLSPTLDDSQLRNLYENVYKPTTAALGLIEDNGVYVRRDILQTTVTELVAARERAKATLQALYTPSKGEFNPNSPKQVAHVLFDLLKLKPHHYSAKTAAPSTDELSVKMLAQTGGPIAQEFVQALLDYRENGKLISTYLLPYSRMTSDEQPRIFPGYSITTTVTCRSSSFNPNLQNVPRDKRIRKVIGAPPGKTFLQADYSMLELRVAAHVAREKKMIAAICEGKDLHRLTAATVCGKDPADVTDKERTEMGKIPNFSLLYCAEVQTFIDNAFKDYGIRFSRAEATAIRDGFYASWPDLEPWYGRCADEIKATQQIRSITGQIRRLPQIQSTNIPDKTEALRMGINFCVQNPAAHTAEIALWMATERFNRTKDRLVVGFIHDAIQLELPEAFVDETAAELRQIMEQEVPAFLANEFGINLEVPLVADIGVGPSWGEQTPWTA